MRTTASRVDINKHQGGQSDRTLADNIAKIIILTQIHFEHGCIRNTNIFLQRLMSSWVYCTCGGLFIYSYQIMLKCLESV